ncbi:MAG TPA: S41 family peptidase [Chitinophagaceae bacterium]|jgi:carboxyl-terminal processing protease|nr:S41 family peptidase [Chitinophagaceae bacterium]
MSSLNLCKSRKIKTLPAILILAAAPLFLMGQTNQITSKQYQEDFIFFWKTIHEEYCYFNKKQTDWQKIKEIYESSIDSVSSWEQLVAILEKALYEIYDHHAILNTNNNSSYRLVPSGTDVWAEYINGKPIITEVRKGFGAESAGIIAGMEIVAVNDIYIEAAIKPLLPKSLKLVDTEAKNFVLRLLLAGNHVQKRKFTLKYQGRLNDYYPDKNGLLLENINHSSLIESRFIGNTGYIKINDCVYNTELISEFDSVMRTMQKTMSLILDLRETPSGGNTTVARAILGWFINKEHFYQKHEYYAEENNSGVKRSWEEIVSPRKGKYYGKPLVILCDHWTASLGEAITIGFDALQRPGTKIIGTPMARLNGAVYTYEMPNSKIRFSFPAERLYHINALPREEYIPQILINPATSVSKPTSDIFISKALLFLK